MIHFPKIPEYNISECYEEFETLQMFDEYYEGRAVRELCAYMINIDMSVSEVARMGHIGGVTYKFKWENP